jgi:hypothetical protein
MSRYRQREWVSESEWRKRKRAKAKALLEEQRQAEAERQEEQEQIKKRLEAISAGKLQSQKTVSLSTKLWAWGVNSEKHPTYSMGVFPMIIMYLFVVPVLGLLYKLSFTWLGPVMIVGAALIGFIFQKMKR